MREVRRLLNAAGMRCWGVLARMIGARNLAVPHKVQRAQSVQYIKDCIYLAAELDGQLVSLAPLTLGKLTPDAPPEEEWQWLVESMRHLYEYALEASVVLAIAPVNRYETYLLNRCEQALALAQSVGPACGICLDTFHMNLEETDPLEAMRLAGKRLTDFHVADNNRLACGMGTVDWKAIVNVLDEIGYDGALTVEFVPRLDLVPAPAYDKVGLKRVQSAAPSSGEPIDLAQIDEAVYEFLVRESAGVLRPLIDLPS